MRRGRTGIQEDEEERGAQQPALVRRQLMEEQQQQQQQQQQPPPFSSHPKEQMQKKPNMMLKKQQQETPSLSSSSSASLNQDVGRINNKSQKKPYSHRHHAGLFPSRPITQATNTSLQAAYSLDAAQINKKMKKDNEAHHHHQLDVVDDDEDASRAVTTTTTTTTCRRRRKDEQQVEEQQDSGDDAVIIGDSSSMMIIMSTRDDNDDVDDDAITQDEVMLLMDSSSSHHHDYHHQYINNNNITDYYEEEETFGAPTTALAAAAAAATTVAQPQQHEHQVEDISDSSLHDAAADGVTMMLVPDADDDAAAAAAEDGSSLLLRQSNDDEFSDVIPATATTTSAVLVTTADVAVVVEAAAASSPPETVNNNGNDDNDNDAFCTTGFVVLNRQEIFQQAIQSTQAAFEQELNNATITAVAVVRERTTKEKMILWALLVCIITSVVLGVVLGVVFGVVVDNGNNNASLLVENAVCSGAKDIQSGTSAVGSISFTDEVDQATSDQRDSDSTTVTLPVCPSRNDGVVIDLSEEDPSPLDSGRRWFRVVVVDDVPTVSSDYYLNVTTCSNATDFDAQLSIFQGAQSCEALQCVDARTNDDYSCGNRTTVLWRTRRSNNNDSTTTNVAVTSYYFILVHDGVEHGKAEQEEGNFVLTVQTVSRFTMVVQQVRNEFGLEISPTDDPNTPQFRAAKWLEDDDTWTEFPLQTEADRLEFRQRYALAVFYFATAGHSWRSQLNFLNARMSVCAWNDEEEHGAVCDEKGIVRSLSFGRNNLKGTLPLEIVGLQGLLRLDIDSNLDFDPWLETISKLPTLTSLHISGCRINGVLPRQIGQLTALTSLELLEDKITVDSDGGGLPPYGSIPREIGQLSNLKLLRLSELWVKGIIPTQLMALTALTSLSIRDMESLGGSVPKEINQLSNLRFLDLSDNNFGVRNGYVVPSEIGALSLLEVLDLGKSFKPAKETFSTSRLPERLQAAIGNLTQLRELYLHDNEHRGSIPSSYANLVNLEKLHLQRNKLTGPIPTFLGNFVRLVELGLDGNEFSGAPASSGICLSNLAFFRSDDYLGCWNCCEP